MEQNLFSFWGRSEPPIILQTEEAECGLACLAMCASMHGLETDLLMLRLSPSSEMGTSVGAILLGAQRAADLVDKMLAYAGERHGSTSRIDLDHLVRDLLDLLQTSAARHCTLHYEGTPAIIDADATQIRQVVT